MATASQITANKLNSQKSSGPKTDEGKAKSALNRLSHGFASSVTRLMPGENLEDLQSLVEDLMTEHQPATPTEQIFVEKMAQQQWLSLRAFRLQSGLFVNQMIVHQDKFGVPKDLGLLIRYQTSAERAFHQAHTDLVKTQKERKKSEIGFEPQAPGETVGPPPAPSQIEPKTPDITWLEPDIKAEVADLVAQAAHADWEICPEALEYLKTLA